MWWGLLGVVIFSISLPMAKVALAWFDPVVVAFSRVVIAAGLSAVALIVTKSAWPTWRSMRLLVLAALGGSIGARGGRQRVASLGHGGLGGGGDWLPATVASLGGGGDW